MTTNNNDQNAAPPEAFARITPLHVAPAARASQASAGMQKKSVSTVAVGIALLVLLLLAAGVFLWLPQRSVAPLVAAQTAAPVTVPEPTPAPELADADTLLDEREQAQNLAAQVQQKRQQLGEQGVQQWAAQAYAENATLAAQAQQQFDGRDYQGAIASYTQADAQTDALLKQSEQVFSDALAHGAKALAAKDSAAATSAYTLALAVMPEDAQAQKGLRRAQSLDAVLAKMQAGDKHERAGDLTAAKADYKAALALDTDYTQAGEALSKVQAQLDAGAFEQQMSRGLAALDSKDYGAARKAFQAANKLQPAAANAVGGLAQANAGLQQQAINRHQQKAQAAVGTEHWQQALDEFQAVLKRDPNLIFAQAGAKRAQQRLQLDQQLQYHLDHSQRLTDGDVQVSAEKTLQQARAVTDGGARLRGQIQKLAALLTTMKTPAQVQLQSDDKTEVLVYHVGKLGKFTSKTLELTPGEYTVVGRCSGYRDVRRTITVRPGQAQVGPVTIRCEEKI